jgi:hypothetical protein
VFFMDSDDYLPPGALGRMCAFAVEHGSDVVVPKIVGVEGRTSYDSAWRSTQVDADLRRAFLTLVPMKLCRRELLDAHQIRFPEGKVRLEDGIFVAKAYLAASRVSILADRDYYCQRDRSQGGNISRSPVEPAGYARSVGQILSIIRAECPDPALRDELVLLVYRRKALRWFAPHRFARFSEARRAAWVTAVRQLADEHVPPELERRLPYEFALRSSLVRRGDVAAVSELALADPAGTELSALTRAPLRWRARRRLVAVGRHALPLARRTGLGRRVSGWVGDRVLPP